MCSPLISADRHVKLSSALLLQISSTRSLCRHRQVWRRGATPLIWLWDRRRPLGHVYAPFSVSNATCGCMYTQHNFTCMFMLPETNPALFSFQTLSFNVLPNTHIVLSFFVSIWAPSLLSFPPPCFLFHTHTPFPFSLVCSSPNII